ncbi:MAG: lysophospholipid acyltransferase family protein [Halanaerobiaceae bacterium]
MLNKLKNIIIYCLFMIFYFIIKILPDRLRLYFGKGFGRFAYMMTGKRRKIAEKNLKLALGEKFKDKEIEKIIKKVYQHLGLVLVEFIMQDDINENNYKKFFEIQGVEYLKEAFSGGKGVILYSAHLGNWEWLAAFISLLGYPVNAIAYEQKNSYFNKKINNIREKSGVNIIPKGFSVREAYKKLKKGEGLYILGDQSAHSNGWKTDFFGQPSLTYQGAVQLAQRTGAVILPVFFVRKDWNNHQMVFYPPREVAATASEKEQKQELQELTSLVEKEIEKNVPQWLWLHRRWKKRNS